MDEITRMKRLQRPAGPIDVILDTDTYNEIDDQFALSYLIKSDDKLNLQAIYAAPFFNDKSTGPKDGMEKSYEEIMRLLTFLGKEEMKAQVYKGSGQYLPDEHTPVESEAARDLVERIHERKSQEPLYVVAIGAITNIASAILMDPSIIEKMVIVWLGGHAWEWHDNKEFNLDQDIAAARIIFGCGVPLVQLPCMGVVSAFTSTRYELKHWLAGKNPLCDYLLTTTVNDGEKFKEAKCWSRAIWDVTAVAWLLDEKFMWERYDHSPIPEYDGYYSHDKRRHMIKYVYGINRDVLFEDLFDKLTGESEEKRERR
ncbi:MAG: nucleoside hydrolase [Clostridia bacterium]|nr:nucleoside hydrolase [Clostridia bacterium]